MDIWPGSPFYNTIASFMKLMSAFLGFRNLVRSERDTNIFPIKGVHFSYLPGTKVTNSESLFNAVNYKPTFDRL